MQFLLERLAVGPTMSTGQPEAFCLETAVAAQIQRIVSARPVEAPNEGATLLEFGMPSIVDVAQNDKKQLEKYATRLAGLIAHYEPRLLYPRVTLEASQNVLMPYRMVVSGSLKPDSDAHTFRFELSDS